MDTKVILKISKNPDLADSLKIKLKINDDDFQDLSVNLSDYQIIQNQSCEFYQNYEKSYVNNGRTPKPLEQEITHVSIQELGVNVKTILDQWLGCLEAENEQNISIFSDQFKKIREKILISLKRDQDNIRFFITAEDPQIFTLPFEFSDLFLVYPKATVTFSFANQKFSAKNIQFNQEIKVLIILAETKELDLQKDLQIWQKISQDFPQIKVKDKIIKNHEKLSNILCDNSYDLIFFAGHSKSGGNKEKGQFFLYENVSISIEDLKYSLTKQVENKLKLVIFNSCDSIGLAKQLADLNLPAIIAMRNVIPDEVAPKFLDYLLTSLIKENNFLDQALKQAKERLAEVFESEASANKHFCVSWMPILFQNSLSPRIKFNGDQENVSLPNINEKKPEFLLIKIAKLIITTLIITLLLLIIRATGFLQFSELKAYDHLINQRPIENIDSRFLVVEITQNDVDQYGGYPLEDQIIVNLLNKLENYQPNLIALDLHRHKIRGKGRTDLIKHFQEHKNLFIVCAYDNFGKDYEPIPELLDEQFNEQIGFSNIPFDPDQLVRRNLLSYDQELNNKPNLCTTQYSLSLLLTYKFLEHNNPSLSVNNNDQWESSNGVIFKPLTNSFGSYQNLKETTQIMLNYRSKQPKPAQYISLNQVLNGEFNPQLIKNKIILVGYTAPVAKDNFQTPLGEMSGVWLHTQMSSQLISTVMDGRSQIWVLPMWREILWILSWGIIGGLVTTLLPSKNFIYSGLAILILILGNYYISLNMLIKNVWMPLIPSVLALFITATTILIINRYNGKKMFNHYFPLSLWISKNQNYFI